MKIDRLKALHIINEELNEVFDFNNISNYDFAYYDNDAQSVSNGIKLIGDFKLDDGAKVEVYAQNANAELINLPPVFNLNHGAINLAYAVEGVTTQYKKTTLSELLRIIKTVSLIIQKYVTSHNENTLYVLHSESKMGNDLLSDAQKSEMYQMIISKHLPTGFRIGEGIYDNGIPIIAFQKNKIRVKH
jgi:hypothetical protein